MNKYAIFGISIFLCVIACGPHAKQENPGQIIGIVRFIEIEGGFYGIITDDGQNYDPINLPEEYKKDGARIRFTAKKTDDQTSFHMWGTIVELTNIEKLENREP